MSKFKIHTIESAPASSASALRALEHGLGFVPNLAATMAESPALVCGFVDLRKTLAGGELTGVEREIVALATSIENDCDYCMAAHSTFALMQDADAGTVAAARAGNAPDDAKLGALYRFARELVARKGHISEAETQALCWVHTRRAARGRRPGGMHDAREPRRQHQRDPARQCLRAAGVGGSRRLSNAPTDRRAAGERVWYLTPAHNDRLSLDRSPGLTRPLANGRGSSRGPCR